MEILWTLGWDHEGLRPLDVLCLGLIPLVDVIILSVSCECGIKFRRGGTTLPTTGWQANRLALC